MIDAQNCWTNADILHSSNTGNCRLEVDVKTTPYESRTIHTTPIDSTIVEGRQNWESWGLAMNDDYCVIYWPWDNYTCWFGDSDTTSFVSTAGKINEFGTVSSHCSETVKAWIKVKPVKNNYLDRLCNLEISTFVCNNYDESY